MAVWEANIFGDTYQIDAPDEGQAATQALKLRQQAAQADPKKAAAWVQSQPADQREQPSPEAARSPFDNAFDQRLSSSVLGDVAGSVSTGARNLAESTVGLPGDITEGVRYIDKKLLGTDTKKSPLPTTADIHDFTSQYVGPSYRPASTAGEIAKTGAEVSSALLSPGSASRKLVTWLGGTAGNEVAGRLAHEFAPIWSLTPRWRGRSSAAASLPW
jgi:hypothetical protein